MRNSPDPWRWRHAAALRPQRTDRHRAGARPREKHRPTPARGGPPLIRIDLGRLHSHAFTTALVSQSLLMMPGCGNGRLQGWIVRRLGVTGRSRIEAVIVG